MSKISVNLLKEKENFNSLDDSDPVDYNDHNDLQSVKPLTGSYFDLTFKPTDKVTYKTILPQVLACVSAASFHLPIGLVVAYSAIMLDQLEQKETEIMITKVEGSWIASSTILVVPVAAILTGFFVDRIGRVSTLKAASVPYIVGWTVIATATNLTSIIVGRVLTGFALAMGSSPAVVYITEVARPDLRGALICLGPAMTSFGMVLVYLAGCFLHWRTVAWLNIGFALIPVILMYLFTPESPAWLVSRGRNQEALKACKVVSEDKAKDLIHQRRVKLLEREHERKSCTPDGGVLYKLMIGITKPTVYKPFAILSMCFFFQQMSGIYVLILYAVTFFKDVDSEINPYILSVVVGVIRMFVGLITSQLLYKFGRRSLCLSSLLSMAVLMFTSGGCILMVRVGVIEKDWLLVPIICLLFYICMSTMGLMSIPWTLTAEMYPLEVRGVMQGVTVCVAHILMFAVIKSFYWMSELLGGTHAVQLFFGGVCLVGFVFLWLFLPETHKKTLEEIVDYFENNTIYILRRKSIYDDRFPVKYVDGDNQNV